MAIYPTSIKRSDRDVESLKTKVRDAYERYISIRGSVPRILVLDGFSYMALYDSENESSAIAMRSSRGKPFSMYGCTIFVLEILQECIMFQSRDTMESLAYLEQEKRKQDEIDIEFWTRCNNLYSKRQSLPDLPECIRDKKEDGNEIL